MAFLSSNALKVLSRSALPMLRELYAQEVR